MSRPGEILDEVWGTLEAAGVTVVSRALTPPARYNLAPTQAAAMVLEGDGMGSAELARWGLESAASSGRPLINARLETVREKPTFAEALAQRRCLVPADGFYEWTRGSGQPHFFSRPDRRGFCFAGIWQPGNWQASDGPRGSSRSPAAVVRAFCILTAPARAPVAEIHPRMPLLLSPSRYLDWLRRVPGDDDLRRLAQDSPSLVRHPVGLAVNRIEIDEPSLLDAAEPLPENLSLF